MKMSYGGVPWIGHLGGSTGRVHLRGPEEVSPAGVRADAPCSGPLEGSPVGVARRGSLEGTHGWVTWRSPVKGQLVKNCG
jgi:hypothetical protein